MKTKHVSTFDGFFLVLCRFFVSFLFYNKVWNAAFAGRIKSAEKLFFFRALCFLQLVSASSNAFSFNCFSTRNFFPVKGQLLSGAIPAYGIGLKCYCDCDLSRADTRNFKKNTRKMRG